ncbi:AAA family ATPase [Rhodobacter capsulatus]|uniref:AAA family ATPase n=1 Tax=Rhodobacter capsulatus TaxID=1061 RepID=UPI004027CE03
MDLTLKHLGREEYARRRLEILLTREKLQELTDAEHGEVLELQIELCAIRGLSPSSFRRLWYFKSENDLDRRHNSAQVLAAQECMTVRMFRRRLDLFAEASTETMLTGAIDALRRSQTTRDILFGFRAECSEPEPTPDEPADGPAEPGETYDWVIDADKLDELAAPKPKPRAKHEPRKAIVHRYQKSGGKDDKERDEFARRLAEPKIFAGPGNVDDVDVVFAALYDESPWLVEPIKHMWTEARANAAAGQPFGFNPALLFGGAGLGKSYLTTALAQLIGCTAINLNGGNMSAAFDISGVEKAWRSAGPGVCVKAIHDYGIANPLVVFDELDKTPRGSSGGDPQLALLPLLQSDTAEGYRCPYVQGVVDLSWVNWLACANDISNIPKPLLDRFAVFEIHPPTGELLMHFLERRFSGLDVPRIKMIELKRAIEKGRISIRGALKLEERLRAFDARPILN